LLLLLNHKFCAYCFVVACYIYKIKDEKKNETPATKTTTTPAESSGSDAILGLDITTLKDEAGFLKTWEDLTTARIADEKKRDADKNYEGHYLEYLKMYTKLLNATTVFSKTLQPAAAAVTFNEKISAIQSKMYPSTK
jgi:hypothetical protein